METNTCPSLWRLNCLVYAGAMTVETLPVARMKNTICDDTSRASLKAELERRKKGLRYTKRGRRRTGVDWVRRKFGKLTSNAIRELIVQMNDLVQMKSRQFRDAKTRDAIKTDNHECRTNGAKAFMRTTTTINPPDISEIGKFWETVLGRKGRFDTTNVAITGWRTSLASVETNQNSNAPYMMKKVCAWKAAGRDRIKAYWWKRFVGALNYLHELFMPILRGEETLPQWFVTGRTILIPKSKCYNVPQCCIQATDANDNQIGK